MLCSNFSSVALCVCLEVLNITLETSHTYFFHGNYYVLDVRQKKIEVVVALVWKCNLKTFMVWNLSNNESLGFADDIFPLLSLVIYWSYFT